MYSRRAGRSWRSRWYCLRSATHFSVSPSSARRCSMNSSAWDSPNRSPQKHTMPLVTSRSTGADLGLRGLRTGAPSIAPPSGETAETWLGSFVTRLPEARQPVEEVVHVEQPAPEPVRSARRLALVNVQHADQPRTPEAPPGGRSGASTISCGPRRAPASVSGVKTIRVEAYQPDGD